MTCSSKYEVSNTAYTMRVAATAVFGAENACAELAKQAAMRTDVADFMLVEVPDVA